MHALLAPWHGGGKKLNSQAWIEFGFKKCGGQILCDRLLSYMLLTEVCHLNTTGNTDVDYVVPSLNACNGNFTFCEFIDPKS